MVYDLILMDGTVLQTTASGVGQQGDLWIHVVGIDFMNCVTIFEDPKKTEKMYVQYSPEIKDEFVGYTELFSVSVGDGFIKVGLARGGDADGNS